MAKRPNFVHPCDFRNETSPTRLAGSTGKHWLAALQSSLN
jgi:hypothetical protein